MSRSRTPTSSISSMRPSSTDSVRRPFSKLPVTRASVYPSRSYRSWSLCATSAASVGRARPRAAAAATARRPACRWWPPRDAVRGRSAEGLETGGRVLRGGWPCHADGKAQHHQDPVHQGTGTSSSGLKFPSMSRNARTVLVPCASDTMMWNIDGSVNRARSVSEGPDGPLGCE